MKDSTYPSIKTERLILRQFELSDAKEVQRMAGDRDVARNTLNMPYPYFDGLAEQWITSLESDYRDERLVVFAITLADSGTLIGAIGLTLKKEYKLAELGYWIGKEYWNKGYGTEAVKAIIKFGFYDIKLHKIFANYFANNLASGRIMEKAGMVFEGILRSHLWHFNEYKDLIFYGIFNPEEVK
jgi:[ribosomal protein S5]-alanine N-acetyltransferase